MTEYFVGLMSGTSLDGVDAALVVFDGNRPHCTATHYRPFDDDLKKQALDIQTPGNDELRRAAQLGNRLADSYAEAVNALLADAKISPAAVRAIGCHGQTVRHAPADGYTIQLGNAARLAEATGIAVVADFRSRDIAAGGQGAPLVPALHDALFRTVGRHRVIANIGGIANLTDLAPGKPARGFDCGPGNMLLDAWIGRCRGLAYDAGGTWAATGICDADLLGRLLAHPFFLAQPPKSCGREEFGLPWLLGELGGQEAPADVQATLVALTADSLAEAVRRHCGSPDGLFVCGGGAHNATLMQALRERLPQTAIDLTDALGLPADWVEAVAFAWLARQTLNGVPGNLPATTGARGPRVLGAVYPA